MAENMPLGAADNEYLRFLRRQVDRLEHIRYTQDAPNDLDHQLRRAREELRKFVDGKRMQGYLI